MGFHPELPTGSTIGSLVSRAPDRSLVIVEQYLDEALRLADIAYRMRRGEVVYSGDPRGAVGSPRPHAASGHKRERPHGV